jgi:hypothetical protein
MLWRFNRITLPGLVAHIRTIDRSPESRLTFPVNSFGPCIVTSVSTASGGRTTSSSPETTTKKGIELSPCSTNISSLFILGMCPRVAMRLICSGVNFGISVIYELLLSESMSSWMSYS